MGNFVELKATRLGDGAKANHLSYLGDSTIGARTNIGAGTVTCNYDGYAKHRTEIGEGVFVGTHSTLVAPVALGGWRLLSRPGSVITHDVAAARDGVRPCPAGGQARPGGCVPGRQDKEKR